MMRRSLKARDVPAYVALGIYGKRGARACICVSLQVIAIVEGAGEGSFNVANGLPLEKWSAIGVVVNKRRRECVGTSNSSVVSKGFGVCSFGD